MYIDRVSCALHIAQLTLCTAHNALYTIRCIPRSVHCTIYVHCTLDCAHCSMHIFLVNRKCRAQSIGAYVGLLVLHLYIINIQYAIYKVLCFYLL